MRLIFIPCMPGENSGYEIAVKQDLQKLKIKSNDVIFAYVKKMKEPVDGIIFIKRKRKISLKYIWNIIKQRPGDTLYANELNEILKNYRINKSEVSEIFCGEVYFYQAVRDLFYNKKVFVRFHNLYYRVYCKYKSLLRLNLSFKYRLIIHLFSNVEKDIFRDTNVSKIFISNEEAFFYDNITKRKDYQIWNPILKKIAKIKKAKKEREVIVQNFIWFGSLSEHKSYAVKFFIKEVFIKLSRNNPNLKFHLYGNGSKKFTNVRKNIFGHGFFDGDSLPKLDNSVFINPDILGGGIKIKLLKLLNEEVTLISTPEGFEGVPIIDNTNVHIVPFDNWTNYIQLKL